MGSRCTCAGSIVSWGTIVATDKRRFSPAAIIIVGIIVLVAVVFVATSLRQPAVEAYAPTPATPRLVGDALIGPVRYTVDASSAERWRYFSFAQGSTVEPRAPTDWDLAFRRFHIIANGGTGFGGRAAVANVGPIAFESVLDAPAAGYKETRGGRDSVNEAFERWYDYGWTSHLLRPKPNVWVVRTADGRFAKLRIVSYYCPGAQPGCVTFEYVYQGSGSRRFTGPASSF